MAGKKLVLIDLGGMAQGTREACSKTWDTASSLALENTRWNDADFFFFEMQGGSQPCFEKLACSKLIGSFQNIHLPKPT